MLHLATKYNTDFEPIGYILTTSHFEMVRLAKKEWGIESDQLEDSDDYTYVYMPDKPVYPTGTEVILLQHINFGGDETDNEVWITTVVRDESEIEQHLARMGQPISEIRQTRHRITVNGPAIEVEPYQN